MKLYLYLIATFMTQNIYAASLLIPSPNISEANYWQACHQTDFICTQDYFTSLINQQPTPHFDQLMESLDFNSKQFKSSFYKKITSILNSEVLDEAQLNFVILVFEKLKSENPNIIFNLILNDLKRIQTLFKFNPIEPKSDFILLFKRKIALKHLNSLRSTVLKAPVFMINYSSLPHRTDSFHNTQNTYTRLVDGDCHNRKVIWTFNIPWKIYDDHKCSVLTNVKEKRPFTREPLL